jgi:glycosyltransferase involved in cell wall biosynthesis/Flp pilus assembly protein TadD
MIVRDEAQTLRRCLESVRGVVREIVIADTGSKDNTPQIAREYGAQVIEIPWEDDFAKARNRALAPLSCDWVLSLDADEMLDPSAGAAVGALTADQTVAAYQVTIRNYMRSLDDCIWDRPAIPNNTSLPEAQAYPAYVEHENVRLFRRHPAISFVGRVHESVGPSVEAAKLKLGQANFLIHHFGLAFEPKTQERKNRFYRELGELKIQDMPRNAQAQLELGLLELNNFGEFSKALACFERACELNPRFGIAWFFAGVTHIRRQDYAAALRCLREAERCGHATAAVAESLGDTHYNRGEFTESVKAYILARKRAPESPQLESKLGFALGRTGAEEEALLRMTQAVLRQPKNGELHDRRITFLAWRERISEAAQAAEDKLRAVPNTSARDFLRTAGLWAQNGDWARATAILKVGLQLHADNELLLQALRELSAREGNGVNQLATALQDSCTGRGQN